MVQSRALVVAASKASLRLSRRAFHTRTVHRTPFNILFCGTDQFALQSLRTVFDNKHLYNNIHVITPPDASNKWRRATKIVDVPPVKLFAQENGIAHSAVPAQGIQHLTLPAPFDNRHTASSSNAYNILITASFGHLIPPNILSHFRQTNTLNVHPSLLPELRGAAPIQWAIARQARTTGVSIQTLGKKFDTGNILAQCTFDIPKASTYASLRLSLQDVAARLLLDTLNNFDERTQNSWSQSEERIGTVKSLAPKLRRESAIIKWDKWNARTIEARHRAFGYLFPLTTMFTPRPKVTQTKEAQLRDVELPKDVPSEVSRLLDGKCPGSAVYDPSTKKLFCRCFNDHTSSGDILQINALQTIGRKATSSEEWIKGYGDPQQRYREVNFISM